MADGIWYLLMIDSFTVVVIGMSRIKPLVWKRESIACFILGASRLFTQPFIQGADQRKHQSSASLAFVRGIPRWPVNSPQKGPVTRKMFSFDDVIMNMFGEQDRARDSQWSLEHWRGSYRPHGKLHRIQCSFRNPSSDYVFQIETRYHESCDN